MLNRYIKKDSLRVGLLVPLFNLTMIPVLQLMVPKENKKSKSLKMEGMKVLFE